MSLLVLVRHGQASFLTDNYDRLSELGQKQARLLGEFWCDQSLKLDAIYAGELKRQIDSAEIVREVYAERGLPCPPLQRLPELNEYQAEEFLYNHLHELREIDPALDLEYQAFKEATEKQDRYRTYQRMFETAMRHWLGGAIQMERVESWKDFVARVESAIGQMTNPAGSGSHIAAFTSGGPIGVGMQYALNTTAETTLQLSWMVRNASLTTFLFTQGKFTLSSFNEIPHLQDRALWSYR
ncbi:MAG: histidine phosphatase family protein [Candidatus Omnitrophica bacterium]|nr:histidine phosphatase family protein [Candidatus Omnitrophota bacterium]